MCAKSLQFCLTLCEPMDYNLPGSSVHGDSPGKNTGGGCHALLQVIFLTQSSNPCLLCLLHWEDGSLPLEPSRKPNSPCYLLLLAGWSQTLKKGKCAPQLAPLPSTPPEFGASDTLNFLPLPSNGRHFLIPAFAVLFLLEWSYLCPHNKALLSSRTKLKCPLLWVPFVITPWSMLDINPFFFCLFVSFLYYSTFHIVSWLLTKMCVGFLRAISQVLLDLLQSSCKGVWPFLIFLWLGKIND